MIYRSKLQPNLGNPLEYQLGANFENSNPDEAVKDFTDIILSTMSQFIPNTIITINERDLPWLTKSIKNKIKSKHRAYHKFLSHGSRSEEKAYKSST